MSDVVETRVRALVEEQLAEIRYLSSVPAAEIEAIAYRITQAIGEYINAQGQLVDEPQEDAA
ncbi:MAG: hypothetical protein AAGG56_05870 [Pseudomonadota bacterium]